MSDVATIQQRQPADYRPIGKPPRPPRVAGKLVIALQAIVREGQDLQQAAQAAGLTTHTLRRALEKPHVIAYLKAQKDVFRAYISGQNIHRLAEIRDASGNAMAKLGAIKLLEQVDEHDQRSSAGARSPGVVIIVGSKADVTIEPVKRALTVDDG